MSKKIISLALLLFWVGCTVGPDYKRPPVKPPDQFRGATDAVASKDKTSLADQKWAALYQDQELQNLIGTAMKENYDVRIAATRIEQARAQLGITRADQFPTISAGASVTSQQQQFSDTQAFKLNSGEVDLSLAWSLDFWGKYRRASEAARAELLATEWGRQEVTSTLVSDVATAYFQLRELDLELEIAQRTLTSRRDSLQLTKLLSDRGLRSNLDVRQSEQLVYAASVIIPDLERRIEQQENFIRLLLGQYPGPVVRGVRLTDQPHSPEVPAGLPSSLLERRPDIRAAEQTLIAFNARIGVAKAAYFPDITLTGRGGLQSSALADLFNAPGKIWNVAASLVQPIFAAGRIRSGVRVAQAQRDEALLVYQQTIRRAFREVSDALVAYRKNQEFRAQQELLTQSAGDSLQLSDLRYRAGTASYLEVLDANTRYFAAELGLAQARLSEMLALVELYRALGGGWQG
jgi:outer membrane protein, multidrug efflux system